MDNYVPMIDYIDYNAVYQETSCSGLGEPGSNDVGMGSIHLTGSAMMKM